MKDILSYTEITNKENFQIQRGMNYRPAGKRYSIFLMSTRKGSPYNDSFSEDGSVLFYEGEDIYKSEVDDPKDYDQPFFNSGGSLTNNGKFFKRVEDFKYRRRPAEKIKVYEKIKSGIWSDKGFFKLIDAKYIKSEEEGRKVFKFILKPIKIKEEGVSDEEMQEFEFTRRIPTEIKREVWKRDKGKCVKCGAKENLHFDHNLPYSKGGTSINAKNIQLLCQSCNLKKSNKIE